MRRWKHLKQNDNYETWKNETCRTLTIATGKLDVSVRLAGFAEQLMKAISGSRRFNVYAIRNDFFGETDYRIRSDHGTGSGNTTVGI